MKTEAVADNMPIVSKKDRHNRGNVANRALKPVHAHNWKLFHNGKDIWPRCEVTSRKDRYRRGNVANQPINPVHAHRWKVILSECYSTMEKTFGRDVKSPQGKTDTVEAMWLTSQ
ncbi:hypothetical protein T05_1744 [Trichinella murrelli]|uniref:Uncharacterized protein n=1 Tax=Trichinella murrelli TaxID=144512 RepID=A0A0V0U249_9BILA|nr:hypothetical protein T05_1744 [Trichinella murrelli]